MNYQNIEVVLIDLGGVLVELGDISSSTTWFKPELSAKENWDLWLSDPASQALERGEISPEDFARGFLERNQIDLDVDTFIQQFKDWVIGFYPGALSFVQTLSSHYRLGIFSNITDVHWPQLETELIEIDAITHYFASYLIGYAKPEPKAFRYVCNQMNVRPEQVLFVDDNLINVEGALQTGMQSEVVKGIGEFQALFHKVLIRD